MSPARVALLCSDLMFGSRYDVVVPRSKMARETVAVIEGALQR